MSDNLQNKYILQKYRQDLEESLTFDDVRDKLHSKFVLTAEDLSSIDELDSNVLKVKTCLNMILERDNAQTVKNFINSLSEMNVQIYNDMYHKLTNLEELRRIKQEKGLRAIARGDVPRKYNNYIRRKEEKALEWLLSTQKQDEIVVLQGLPLCGKTSLASHVLQNPDFVFDHFNNKVFWVDLKNVDENDESLIADHLKRLICSVTKYDNSFDTQRDESLAWYKDIFRSKFHTHCNGGLLILDNLRSEKIFRHFDIRCKMLIIVNKSEYVTQHTTKKIELRNFMEKETTACLATTLSLDAAQLSKIIPIILKIHQRLEGHPQLVALLATYLNEREAIKWNIKRWDNMLSQLDSQFELQQQFKHITQLLLDLLSEKEQNYFKQLVIMPEHVNISPEVLSVYWEISDLNKVEDLLIRFHKLSLLERIVVNDENCETKFIYGLGNFFIKCLKSIEDVGFLVDCHRKLIKAYINKYSDLTMLPNDDYIYNFYGYHLLDAKLPENHFEIFLNLGFIGAKIKYCGVGAILQDFRIYRTFITKNNSLVLTEKLDAYINFVEKCETNLLRNGLDLVQYALRITDNHQIVFRDALEIAKKSPKLYLTWALKNEPHFTRTLDVHNPFNAVLFANNPKLILVGTTKGDIELWNLDTRLIILKYIGHTEGIKELKLSPCKKYFLSICCDLTFKIWKIMQDDLSYSQTVGSEPLSPSLRQRDHHAFFPDEARVSAIADSCDITPAINVTSATFCSNEGNHNVLSLVTCPRGGGELTQWSFQKNISALKFQQHLVVASNAQKLHKFDLAASGTLFLFVYSKADKQIYVVNPHLENDNKYVFIMTLPDSDSGDADITQMLAVNDKLCITIGKKIHILRFTYKQHKETMIYARHDISELPCPDKTLSCASLTENGAYLVTGTKDGFIFLWDLESMRIVKEFTTNNHLVIGLDTYTTTDSIILLLSGSDDSTVKCWNIASDHLPQYNNISSVRRADSIVLSAKSRQRQIFSCNWPENYRYDSGRNFHGKKQGIRTPTVALLNDDNNAIEIYSISEQHTDQLLYSVELPPANVDPDHDNDNDSIVFQLCDNALYYTLRSGELYRYHFATATNLLLWNCYSVEFRDRHIVSLVYLGNNTVLISCNKNSLILIQYKEATYPTNDSHVLVSVLLNPSKTSSMITSPQDHNLIRTFQLHQLNVRILRLLVASSGSVYVLCAKSLDKAYAVNDTIKMHVEVWIGNSYRMETIQGGTNAGDIRVSNCILSSTESHLVLFLSNGTCDIVRLKLDEKSELSYDSVYIFQLDLESKVTSSAISFDGQLLALGRENGFIEIIDVANKSTKLILQDHSLPIESLLFSPKPNYILVSAAETICWWTLQEIVNESAEHLNGMSYLNIENNVWNSKQPMASKTAQLNLTNESSKYLLARISLPGPLKHVTASKDFTSFITLDSLGIMHSFNVIV